MKYQMRLHLEEAIGDTTGEDEVAHGGGARGFAEDGHLKKKGIRANSHSDQCDFK